jgi:hypothetical protein
VVGNEDGGDLDGRVRTSNCGWADSIFEGMSKGFGLLVTVDGMGIGAESDTTGEATTVKSSLLCDVEPSGESDRGMGWAKSELVDVSALPSTGWAAAMSSEVIERAWLPTDAGRDDVSMRIKGCGA